MGTGDRGHSLRSQGAEIHAGLTLLPQLLAPQATASRWPCARPAGSWSAMVGRDGRKGGQCGGARGGWRRRKGENVERRWRWPDDEMAAVRIGSRAAASQREGGGGGTTGRAAGCSVSYPSSPRPRSADGVTDAEENGSGGLQGRRGEATQERKECNP